MREKRSAFGHEKKCIHCLAVYQLKVRSFGHINAGCLAYNAIKAVSAECVQGVFLSPGCFDTFHNFIPILPETIHFRQQGNRMLQVTVHYHAAGTAGSFESGKNGRFFAKISGKGKAFYFRIFWESSKI